ncbi:30S ribosomal protein S9 [Patescibacteria group bacterium]|nr:MAG: 30S ribosomal protein S9 [Patescibacteria group bacterium]
MVTARYKETIGRRKTAGARVRLTESTKTTVVVNGKPIEEYFKMPELMRKALLPLKHQDKHYTITVVVKGGGIAGQAVAVAHGIARALNDIDGTLRPALKSAGHLKRDPRAKERRKPGFKKARKRPQWSKR